VQGARDVVVASYVNRTAVLALLRAALRGGTDVAIVCAGRGRQFSLEDAACAGRYVHHVTRRLTSVELNDAALAASLLDRKYGDDLMRLFLASEHGRALREVGLGDDLAVCGAVDTYGVVPVYQERQITKIGPERER
jgi:2-phosphosulfolactate phosphatase